MVLVAWLVVANRAPSLEPFALERNLAGAVALGLFAAVPIIRFLRFPGPLLAAGLVGWSVTALTYRLLGVYFWGLAARFSAMHLFTLGIIIYMIFATLSWIGSCISRARQSDISH
jgi:hypothetical protein